MSSFRVFGLIDEGDGLLLERVCRGAGVEEVQLLNLDVGTDLVERFIAAVEVAD